MGRSAISTFDFKNPEYAPIYQERLNRLAWIREDKTGQVLAAMKQYYRTAPGGIAQFINDWGVTVDGKLIAQFNDKGDPLASMVPFLLFPKQVDWVNAVVEQWRKGEPMLTEKTRQMGFSWLAMATSCALCILFDNFPIGVGSRKEDLVDRKGDPKSLFEKARLFMRYLPKEFQAGFVSTHMSMTFNTGSTIMGEVGDNIGRGATTALYITDEEAFLEHPETVEKSLSQTAHCRISISTPNGLGNPFAEKRFGGKIRVFTFHWRDDPRKDQAWYEKQLRELDAIVIAQELDIDYAASVEGVVIPSSWVQAAVDAHITLGVTPTGRRAGSFDVADRGRDKLAFVASYGVLLFYAEDWSSPADGDLFQSTQKVFNLCDELDLTDFNYDADGMGAGIRGDARVINERREANNIRQINVTAFRGSAGVERPEAQDRKGRKNKDFFMNAKAQAWNSLRERFQVTYRAVSAVRNGENPQFDPDTIISIDSRIPVLARLCMEISQPTWDFNTVGKMVVDKVPDETRSPNLGDGVMMRFSNVGRPMRISQGALEAI